MFFRNTKFTTKCVARVLQLCQQLCLLFCFLCLILYGFYNFLFLNQNFKSFYTYVSITILFIKSFLKYMLKLAIYCSIVVYSKYFFYVYSISRTSCPTTNIESFSYFYILLDSLNHIYIITTSHLIFGLPSDLFSYC